jgi:hypothetical protein
VAVQDGPGDALRHPAEVFRRIRAGVIRRDRDEEVDRHAQQELDDQQDQGVKELVAHPDEARIRPAPVA